MQLQDRMHPWPIAENMQSKGILFSIACTTHHPANTIDVKRGKKSIIAK